MFTFGIFTTHIPYILMVAFYAYFLLFGVNQTAEGKVEIAEKSITVQVHLNNSDVQSPANTYTFYSSLTECSETDIFEKSKVKQKWKHFGIDTIFSQTYLENSFFGRPPPVFA